MKANTVLYCTRSNFEKAGQWANKHFIVMFIYRKWKVPEKHQDLEHLLEQVENEETRKAKTVVAKKMTKRSKTAWNYLISHPVVSLSSSW